MKSAIKLTAKKNGFILEADGRVLSIYYNHYTAEYFESHIDDIKSLELIYKYKKEVNEFLSKMGEDTFTGSYWVSSDKEDEDCGLAFSFRGGAATYQYAWKSFKTVEISEGVDEDLDKDLSVSDDWTVTSIIYLN